MKSKTRVLGIILALSSGHGFAASREVSERGGGAGDAGGGHGFSSTPQEVRDYLQKPWAAWGGSRAEVDRREAHGSLDGWMAFRAEYAPNAIVKKVLQKMHKAYPGEKFQSAAGSKPIAVSEACYGHEGALSDSSTAIGRLDAPICMNVNSLARYPSESLRTEITALFYHEWTHQLGFGEPEAVEVQNYVKLLLPLVFSVEKGSYPIDLPLRDGGLRTISFPGRDPVTIFCINNERWRRGWNDKTGEFPGSKYTMTIFSGNTAVVGGITVPCSDLPRVDCRVEPANGENCRGNKVYFGPGNGNSACLGSSMFRYHSLQELQAAKICK